MLLGTAAFDALIGLLFLIEELREFGPVVAIVGALVYFATMMPVLMLSAYSEHHRGLARRQPACCQVVRTDCRRRCES
jgi:hypothetical protein